MPTGAGAHVCIYGSAPRALSALASLSTGVAGGPAALPVEVRLEIDAAITHAPCSDADERYRTPAHRSRSRNALPIRR